MNILTIFLAGNPQPVFLYFKDWKDASKARDDLYKMAEPVADDFGQQFCDASGKSISAILIADIDRQLQAQIEVSKKQRNAHQQLTGGVQMPRRIVPS